MNTGIVQVEVNDLVLGLTDPKRFELRYGIAKPHLYDILWSEKHGCFLFSPKNSDIFGNIFG